MENSWPGRRVGTSLELACADKTEHLCGDGLSQATLPLVLGQRGQVVAGRWTELRTKQAWQLMMQLAAPVPWVQEIWSHGWKRSGLGYIHPVPDHVQGSLALAAGG